MTHSCKLTKLTHAKDITTIIYKYRQADSVGHSLLAMYRLTLFALALCLSCAESRVSFTTAEVLDNVDFKGNDEVKCFLNLF